MNAPRRLLSLQAELNAELRRALESSGVEPSDLELQQLTSQVGSALGLTLTPPLASVMSTSQVAKAAAAGTAVKTLPAWKLGAWVLGGVVLGAGLSGAVTAGFATSDNSAPTATVAQRAPEQPKPTPALVEAPAEPLDPQPPLPQTAPSPLPSAVAVPRSAAVASAPATDEFALPTTDELTILHEAQVALAANPARALTLSAQHEREFPGGALTQEREVIAIDALLRLGRVAAARTRAQRFELKYPGSAHARHVEQLLKNVPSR